jgi:hypothetical protein
MSKKTTVDYNLKCLTPERYELEITYKADFNLVRRMFKFSKSKMLKLKGVKVGDHNKLEDYKEFHAPPQYYAFLKTSTTRAFNDVSQNFKQDKIILLTRDVTKAIYKLNEALGWDITITYEGVYSDNR